MTGVIDWDQLWKAKLLSTHKFDLFDKNFWEKSAANLNENASPMANLTPDQLSRLQLLPEYTVLDIGAGTGRLAIPVAKRVKHVTAVEPSVNRLKLLKENVERENVTNITLVNKSWEEIEEGIDALPHDVVFASFSFFMADTEKALKKVDSMTNKRAYIFLSASRWMEDEMQRIIYGNASILQMTDYIFVYNILHDLGICANVEIWNFNFDQSYRDLNEAVTKVMEHYRMPSQKENALREYLQRVLIADDEGKLWLRRKRKAAMIWWTKSE